MARIVTEVTKKLKGSSFEKVEKENKFFDRVAKRNPKTYDGKEDPVVLEEWIRQQEKIFDAVKIPDNKPVIIGVFYLSGQANIWWGTVKTTFQSPEATWSKFNKAPRAKFYPVHL